MNTHNSMFNDLTQLCNDYKQNVELDLTDVDNLDEITNDIYLVYSQIESILDLDLNKKRL